MRLNRFLSSCGLGSRRGCEQIVLDGRVRINGEVCVNLGTRVGPEDAVSVDNRPVRVQKAQVIALHKPKGFVCTREDERDRRTIYQLLPEKMHQLHHVGRLDMDSSGLLLLTNQGELSQQLLHPSKGVEKEYEVTLETPFDPAKLERLMHGFHTEDGLARAERAWMLGDYKLGLVLKQGFKRQIRNMLYFLGYEVRKLVRVRIGNLSLKGLPEGAWKELSEADVDRLLVHPDAKQRPKVNKPRTASVRKRAEKRAVEEKRSAARAGRSATKRGDESGAAPVKKPRRSTSGTRKGGSKRSSY
jgi:23S rRNA pseudouridine2605 synthase